MRFRTKNFALLLTAFIVLNPIVTPLHAEPTLIAHWTFNNTGLDVTGNGFDAELKGNADYIDDSQEGSASLLLNGTSAYATIGEFDFGDTFTITAWTLLDPGSENIQTIIGNAAGGSTIDGFKVYVNAWDTADGRILVETSDGVNRLDAVTNEGVYELDYWNHVAVIFDRPSGAAEIFYNGDPVVSIGSIVTNFQVTSEVYFGAMLDRTWYWHGMIDDVRIYDGVLTLSEINDSMEPISSVRKSPESIPENTRIVGNYPNPFNPKTKISYQLAESGHVEIAVYDLIGRKVSTLLNAEQQAGSYNIYWHGNDDFGQQASTGTYILRLIAGDVVESQKVLLMR
ncbi:T9SS type A sorting domain-containing protein [candidate division KSB1 bacterium]|nr:T9SS type A sorting domain-containing protein [candidate division KSB1 bacterium]